MRVKTEFECAQNDLMKFCEGTTDYICEVNTDTYPLTAVFVPNPQRSIFDAAIDENGEVGELAISVGLDTNVKSTLKFKMDAALLKKLIKKSEKIAFLYYHAFRESAGDLRILACEDNRDLEDRLREVIGEEAENE